LMAFQCSAQTGKNWSSLPIATTRLRPIPMF